VPCGPTNSARSGTKLPPPQPASRTRQPGWVPTERNIASYSGRQASKWRSRKPASVPMKPVEAAWRPARASVMGKSSSPRGPALRLPPNREHLVFAGQPLQRQTLALTEGAGGFARRQLPDTRQGDELPAALLIGAHV